MDFKSSGTVGMEWQWRMENCEWSLCGKRLSDVEEVAGDKCSALALKQLPGRERGPQGHVQVLSSG